MTVRAEAGRPGLPPQVGLRSARVAHAQAQPALADASSVPRGRR